MIKKNRLRRFGHVERKDERYMTWEVEGIRQDVGWYGMV